MNAKKFVFKPLPGKNNAHINSNKLSSVPFGDIEEEKHDSSDEDEEAKYSKRGSGYNTKKNQSAA